jgi:hypothetical protein
MNIKLLLVSAAISLFPVASQARDTAAEDKRAHFEECMNDCSEKHKDCLEATLDDVPGADGGLKVGAVLCDRDYAKCTSACDKELNESR